MAQKSILLQLSTLQLGYICHGSFTCKNTHIAPHVNCYNVDDIFIGSHSTISQYSFLCTASHDISDSRNRLIHQPIIIENQAWLGACCFIGMGVTIGEGSVVGAKSYVYKNIAAWTVVSGNPAKFLKKRKLVK